MQHSADGQSDGTATVRFPRPGFLASVFRDLGADEPERSDGPDGPERPDGAVTGHPGRGAAGDGDGPSVPAPAGPVTPGGADRRTPPPSTPPRGTADQAAVDPDEAIAAHARAAALTHHRTVAVQAEHDRLADLLRRAALPVSAMDFESQLRHYEPRPYQADGPGGAAPDEPEPRWVDFAPAEPAAADPEGGPARRLLDSGYQRELAQARLTHQRALREWRTRRAEAGRPAADESRRAHEAAEEARARAVREYNDSLEECRRAYRLAEPAAVESLLERALAAAETATQDLPAPCRAVFRPLTRTAVLDLDLPPLDLVPSLSGYRLDPDGEILPVPRPPADRATDYLRLVARLALRVLQAADAVDTEEILAGVVLNGWLREPGTAEPLCLVSVDADRDALARTRLLPPETPYEERDDEGVYADAEQDEALVRLRQLGAAVTPDPYERVGVEPAAQAGAAVPAAPDLSANEFAQLVRDLLTRGGLAEWSVRLRSPAGLVATGEGAPGSALPGRWVVWASRGAAPVTAEQIATLAEAVGEESAERGLRLTTGHFTDEALDLTAEESHRHIHLVDGDGVRELARTHLGLPLAAGR
ncbi:restriction system protein [Streptomyces sp. 1114.5]|uniref:restriction endonuclease n=1 Tax=Streptomyces sp. 1114.5 TaxID=1938830 RepID=UPI000EB5723B|nr:restriction endonuclease [Streptomyces sp. 1114.5]RKT17851.1 restriction system protein [Streptomyces sp. 1114.5]